MKRALVTGGSRGLGLAICRQLLSDGWQVVTAARKSSIELDALQGDYRERLEFHPADLSQSAGVSALANRARLLAGVDAFVANAGVGTEGLLTLTPEVSVRECLEVNLVSSIMLAREAVKGMIGQGGSLVFISSVAARTGFSGLAVYAATKGALVAFSRTLAREYGERGIRSNCVLPGFLRTEMSASLSGANRERLARRTPLRRLGEVEDVVGAVRFLLSDEARFITGTELVVDGGLTA